MVQEGQLLAVFNSTHRVMKAESKLKVLGLPILLIPAPRQLRTDCGLAIRFSDDAREGVMQALEQTELLPEFVSRYENGKYVTVWTCSGSDEADPTKGKEI